MESLRLHYEISSEDFTAAGEASSDVKRVLKKLGFSSQTVRRATICMYEGEINMVIHANGGVADVDITSDRIEITLTDTGPGIKNIEEAMQEGFSTASDTVRDLGFGAGMGLPNIKKYSDEMNIETEVGVGTKVSITVYVDSPKG